MAQRERVQLIDDVSGEEAEETVRFSLDGTDYEIDLTKRNAEALRGRFSDYVGKGRKVGSDRVSASSPKSSSDTSSREETQQIRQWAQDNGYSPSARGRITRSIIDAYNESR